jgi:carbon monoxide dehydrogenase subunit G
MQVTLDKQYPVAAGVDAAWAVLSNIPELATCMAGAQITEEIDATHFKGSVRVKVGPAVAAFAGTIEVLSLDPVARTLKMIGKGADKGGSSASMELTATLVPADNGHSTLQGHAEVIVNGKFAQFGGRMMTSVSDMILAQFAETFSQKAQVVQGAAAPVSAAAPGAPAAAAAPAAPAAPVVAKELNGLAIMWMLIRNFFARLFGRQT